MHTHSRIWGWALAVLALLFMLASAFFPAFACHHTCTGDDCPVCLQIRAWTSVLRLLGAGVCGALFLLSFQIAAKLFAAAFFNLIPNRTPVALKTKLLN